MCILQTPKVFVVANSWANSDVFCETISPRRGHFRASEVFVYLFFIAFTVFAVPRLPDGWGFPISRRVSKAQGSPLQIYWRVLLKTSRGAKKNGTSLLHNWSNLRSDSWKDQELLIDQICWHFAEFGLEIRVSSLIIQKGLFRWGLERFLDGTSFRVSWGLRR